MSIMCCVYVPEGIVMAADSRLTRTKEIKDPVVISSEDSTIKTEKHFETTYTLSDTFTSTFITKHLSKL